MRQLKMKNKEMLYLNKKNIINESAIPSPSAKKAKPKIKKIILILLSPIFIGIITFIIGMIIMATGSASSSSFVMFTAQIALLIATLSYIFGPAYLLSIGIYILTVKKFGIEKFKALWIIPCIQTLFTWYPSYIRVSAVNRTLASFFGLTFSALILSILWIGFIIGYNKFRTNKKSSN